MVGRKICILRAWGLWISRQNISPKAKEVKAKNKWKGPSQHISFGTAKEIMNRMKRQPTRWGGNICKQWDRQGINFQNTQTPHATQYKKEKPIQLKSGQSK